MVKHVDDDHTLRRRHCPECDHRWYTAQGREQSIETWRVHWTGRKTIELLPENEVQ
jgi:transcriptional regulator NrdR family protein